MTPEDSAARKAITDLGKDVENLRNFTKSLARGHANAMAQVTALHVVVAALIASCSDPEAALSMLDRQSGDILFDDPEQAKQMAETLGETRAVLESMKARGGRS